MKKKTALEHFQDIKELEVADGPNVTVEDILPYKCEQVEKSLKALEIIKEKDVDIKLATKDKQEFINKLGMLEELEEELGFSLEKLNEITHIYANDWENILTEYKIIGVDFKEKRIWFWDSFSPMYLEFECYKKAFWLKEDKSE